MLDLDFCFSNNGYLKGQLYNLHETAGEGCIPMLVTKCVDSRNEVVHLYEWDMSSKDVVVGIVVLMITAVAREGLKIIMDRYQGSVDSQICAVPFGMGILIAKNSDHITDVVEALDMPTIGV